MKKKFYYENFERLLREKSDEFKMLPSKKTWHSIYNDLHPGKNWPSIPMSLFIIVILGIFGYLNTSTNQSQIALISSANPLANNVRTEDISDTYKIIVRNEAPGTLNPIEQNASLSNKNTTAITTAFTKIQKGSNATKQSIFYDQPNAFEATSIKLNTIDENYTKPVVTEKTPVDIALNKNDEETTALNPILSSTKNIFSLANSSKENSLTVNLTPQVNEAASPSLVSENANNENNSSVSLLPKIKNNLFYTVYVTPNVGFSKLSYNLQHEEITTNDNKNLNDAIKNYPALGFEAGASLIYSLNKRLNFRTGLQFNYTNYSISAYEITHPIVTTLMLNDYNNYPYFVSRLSALSNTSGNKLDNYHNKTYQVSVPVGVDFRIIGNDQLAWYAGASVQPGYVFAGNAYLISSDRNNYVADDGIYRQKWNVNTSIETFISYKTKNDIQLQFGPQYRQQLTSTYTQAFSIDEKLYHIGLKLGMVKPF